MTLMCPSVGAVCLLNNALQVTSPEALILKLYSNNYIPLKTDTVSNYTEVSGGGYSAKTLTRTGWTEATSADPSYIVYGTAQEFDFTGTITVFGYYLIGATSGTLYWAENIYQSGQTFNNGDTLSITPKMTLSSSNAQESGITTSVTLSPSYCTAIGSGGTLTFTATTVGNTYDTVIWSVNGIVGGNSTVGTIVSGVYTAPTVTSKAIRTITATSVTNSAKSASVRVLNTISNISLNVKTQYGATGNGSTDDTAAITSALNASGNGICYVPAGTYKINPKYNNSKYGLYIPSGATLLLDQNAVLQSTTQSGTGSYNIIALREANSAIVGGTVVGDRIARNLPTYLNGVGTDYEVGQGICLGNNSGMMVLGVTSINNCCDGFYIDSSGYNILISDCIANNNRRQGLSLVSCHDVTIQYCTLSGTNGNDPGCGIAFAPSSGSTVTNITVNNCVIDGNAGGGISGGPALAYGPDGNNTAHCNYCTITGCTIENNGGSNYQIGGIWWAASDYINLANSIVKNNQNGGIKLYSHAFNYSVAGNVIINNSGDGIYSSTATNSVISGNILNGNTGQAIHDVDGTATIGTNTII